MGKIENGRQKFWDEDTQNNTGATKLIGLVQTTPFWLLNFVWSSVRRNSNDGQAFCLWS